MAEPADGGAPRAKRASETVQDCLECRLIGSGSMAAIATYFFFHWKTLPRSADPTHRRFHAVLGTVFAAAGLARLLL